MANMTIDDIAKIVGDIANEYEFQVMPYGIDGGQSSIMYRTIGDDIYEIVLRTPEQNKYESIKKAISDFVSFFGYEISSVKFEDPIGFIMKRRFIIEKNSISDVTAPSENNNGTSPNITVNIGKVSKSQISLPNSTQDNSKHSNTNITATYQQAEKPCLLKKIFKLFKK